MARRWPSHLVIDDSVYQSSDLEFARGHVMSPPFRSKHHQGALWQGLQGGNLHTTATDHCTFCAEQKAAKQGRLHQNPERLRRGGRPDVGGVGCGRQFGVELTPSEFVRVTSTNAAQIFNMYPRKGLVVVGADADIVVWDPEGTRTISAKTQFAKGGFNVFEGRTVKGIPSYTLSNGERGLRAVSCARWKA
ncbi:amidohydrolase family protein [Massilia sp. H-1]|nr:amidohydrolase family protein [Massilia sp. H-1]